RAYVSHGRAFIPKLSTGLWKTAGRPRDTGAPVPRRTLGRPTPGLLYSTPLGAGSPPGHSEPAFLRNTPCSSGTQDPRVRLKPPTANARHVTSGRALATTSLGSLPPGEAAGQAPGAPGVTGVAVGQAGRADPGVDAVVAGRPGGGGRGPGPVLGVDDRQRGHDGRHLLGGGPGWHAGQAAGGGRRRGHYSGTFPCLRAGSFSCLLRSMASERHSTARVSPGSMTSSTYPRSAAT